MGISKMAGWKVIGSPQFLALLRSKSLLRILYLFRLGGTWLSLSCRLLFY